MKRADLATGSPFSLWYNVHFGFDGFHGIRFREARLNLIRENRQIRVPKKVYGSIKTKKNGRPD